MRWFVLLGAVAVALIGLWTVTHADGGYRAVGHIGSSLSPGTRRAAGVALLVVSLLLVVLAGTDAI